MCRAALAGDLARARAINNQLLPVHFKLFVEANPIPVKWALAKLGHIGGGIRLPLVPLSAASEPIVLGAMKEAGLFASGQESR
jgi:4-hydroxy-tetrahydrodipicolinate synthase